MMTNAKLLVVLQRCANKSTPTIVEPELFGEIISMLEASALPRAGLTNARRLQENQRARIKDLHLSICHVENSAIRMQEQIAALEAENLALRETLNP